MIDETRTEWGVRLAYDDGTEDTDQCDRELAEARVRWHTERRASVPGWRVTAATLVRRTLTVGRWETVTSPDLTATPSPWTLAASRIANTSALVDQLANALTEIVGALGEVAPGRSETTGWIPTTRVDEWRALLAEHAGRRADR